jgi:probable rRNA maturation factor
MSALTVTSESALECDQSALHTMLLHHMAQTGIDPNSPLGVLFVDEERMTQLHEHWMDEPGPTDVLSFPMDELRSAEPGEPATFGMLGDIVVCLPVALKQSRDNARTLDEEVQFLITHGYLHLLGYDHAEQQEYDAMFRLQDELLGSWRAHP